MGGLQSKLRPGVGGFTWIELLVVLAIIALLVGILMPVISKMQLERVNYKNWGKPRGIHQAMVIFSVNNNGYLPGLDSTGAILKPTDPLFMSVPGNALSGASMSARYFLVLNGKFADGEMLTHYLDTNTQAGKGQMPGTDQFACALLRIGVSATDTDIGAHAGRNQEWRDNANSQAILMCDRNTGESAQSSQVRSFWSKSGTTGADWKGRVMWGDNHMELLNASNARLGTLSLNTKYAGVINSDDFLFGSTDMPGKVGSASAMFGYTSEDF